MPNTLIITQYQTRINDLEKQLQAISRKVFTYSLIRFAIFTGIVLSIYFYIRQDYPVILLFVAMAAVALFLFVVKQHAEIKYQQTILNNLIKINHNEIAILSQKPSFLPDGATYHLNYSYSADLDVFGPRSLYHMIQRCFSEPGRKKLANWLINPGIDQPTIVKKQAAVASVEDDIELRQELLAHGLA